MQRQTSFVVGTVYAADEDVIVIEAFSFISSTGEDAFFYIGGQLGSGSPLPLEGERSAPLRSFLNERIILRLPSQSITDFSILYIWIPSSQTLLADVSIPANLALPRAISLGVLGLTPIQHNIRADEVVIINSKQFRLENFSYDNTAPAVYFWVGQGIPSASGRRVADENGNIDQPLSLYNRETIVITLPDGVTVFDVDYLSVWCEAFRVDFGHVALPTTLDPLSVPLFFPSSSKIFHNCEVLEEDKFQVAWLVDSVRGVICVQLRGRVEQDEYMAFGVSGSSVETSMVGSDVTVAWISAATGQPMVVDYFLQAYSPCLAASGVGACPDDRVGGMDNATLISSQTRDGITYITYEKPLIGEAEFDRNIPTNRPVFISWAYGNINDDDLVTRHVTRTPGDLQINFIRQSSTCPAFVPTGTQPTTPVVPWTIPPINALSPFTFSAQIGPSGGARGVDGITGVVGWGIAWYINQALIPVITVSRGVQYTFVINGGNDPTVPAIYHPFYITDSPRGGYSQQTPAQQQSETIYAGPESGPLCEYTTTTDPLVHSTFDTYRATLVQMCSQAGTNPGILRWTPDNNTPDLVYYQCYTHQYLGWRINVVGVAAGQPCDSQPCMNGGNCIDTSPATFLCDCSGTGFTGVQCQTASPCTNSPCRNGGTCTVVGTGFQCTCASGFAGLTCQVTSLPCQSSPCQNGGFCTNRVLPTRFTCTCTQDFTGTFCEVPTTVSPCANSPCRNGGTCTVVGTGFQCTCASGFAGLTCQATSLPCQSSPCQNGGFCTNRVFPTRFTCTCTQDFTGTFCEVPTTVTLPVPCDLSPCLNGGSCTNVGTRNFQCDCRPMFTGPVCGDAALPCDSFPCQNAGACVNDGSVTGFRCICEPQFVGIFCELPACIPDPCLNGATCTLDDAGQPFCLCQNAFTGLRCEFFTSGFCVTSPCQNNGVCNNLANNMFLCDCSLTRFTGQLCDVPLFRPCDSNPCFNGGTCMDNTDNRGYTCDCVNPFFGVICERTVLPCDSSPCLNGGVCQRSISDSTAFTCNCPASFRGDTCQEPACNPDPCLNGATCFTFPNFPVFCSCPDGFRGQFCENPDGPCGARPCLNGGICTTNLATDVGFTCDCTNTGFVGGTCAQADFCTNNPCQNGGICNQDGNSVSCDCTGTGFTGPSCRQPVVSLQCTANSCQNGGRCFVTGNQLSCDCTGTGFTGTTCNQVDDRCLLNGPCLNGGRCTQVGGAVSCDCSNTGFTGELCDQVIFVSPCAASPCFNGGQCFDSTLGENGFFCDCSGTGSRGITCQSAACTQSFCQNGGLCVELVSSISCDCTGTGFTGSNCERNDNQIAPLRLECPSDICMVGSVGGASFIQVTWPNPVVTGGTPPINRLRGPTTGSAFLPLGASTVIFYQYSDSSNSIVQCSFTITVQTACQSQLQIENCPADMTRTVNNALGTVQVDWEDLVVTGSNVAQTDGPGLSQGTYGLGATRINYTFQDGGGQTATCSFLITVELAVSTAPMVVNCPVDISQTVTDPLGTASVEWGDLIVTGDNVIQVAGPDQSQGNFPVGTTSVDYLFQDGQGRFVLCSFAVTVTVVVSAAPMVVNCPGDISRTVVNPTDVAFVDWEDLIVTGDNVSPILGPDLSQGNYPVGTQNIVYFFRDGQGRIVSCSFTVTVTVAEIPLPMVENCPADRMETVNSPLGSVTVDWADLIVTGQDVRQVFGPTVSRDVFSVGSRTIQYFFQDGLGRTTSCSFTVTVTTAASPAPMVVNCPVDISQTVTNPLGAASLDWEDLMVTGDNVMQITGPALSQGNYGVGTTSVDYLFQDGQGRIAVCSFTVTVTVEDPGSLFTGCPGDITTTVLQGSGGSIVTWTPPTARDQSIQLLNNPRQPGSFFGVGVETVSYVYFENLVEQCQFTISVLEATPCDMSSCLNGGTCIPVSLAEFICVCSGCFRGDRCETVADACSNSQCQNGGTCQLYIGSCDQYFCQCPPCFTGTECQLRADACALTQCANGAVCTPVGTSCTEYSCQCQGCFTGPGCDQVLDACLNNPCQNGGICRPVDGSCTSYTCECQGCISGFNCELAFNPCQNQPCRNGGLCINDANSCTAYTCQCSQCFTGFQCELEMLNPCVSGLPCNNGGTCIPSPVDGGCRAFSCICANGFGGPTCLEGMGSQVLTATDPCVSIPCRNGASCISRGAESYYCICRNGYRGNNCDDAIDGGSVQSSCFAGFCRNGGTCFDSSVSSQPLTTFQYSCLCPTGFTGQGCMLQTSLAPFLDECGNLPVDYCGTNGFCRNLYQSTFADILPICDCAPGFAGQFCNILVADPCLTSPCRNGGQCMTFGLYFVCLCQRPFGGETCELLAGDTTPPTFLNCPAAPIVVRTNEGQAAVTWEELRFEDDSQLPVRVTSANTTPGAVYPVGTSFRAIINVEDVFGNTEVCSFLIQVLPNN
ncbi:uncharacterized protein [Apostichopus japonicus]